MRDVDPRQRQGAGNSPAIGLLCRRQFSIEARRQIALDLEDRLFDEVIVVEKPLRCGRYRLAPRLRGVG
jgi:hypothetical protein